MKNTLIATLAVTSICSTTLIAGDFDNSIIPATAESKLSGSISLDLNSHFISYGLDVWAGGSSATRAWTFNPSLSLDYKISDKLTATTGIWMDVNGNGASSFDGVETDVWAGLAYTSGITTYSATFQNWQYGGTSEEVLDLGVSFDTFLSPSIVLHKRLGAGASGGFNGEFLVVGAEYSYDVSEKLSLTIPLAVGYALSEFHTTEDGYAYTSLGLQGSYALSDSSSLNAGITYYDTDASVTGNAADSFFTYNAGVSFSF